MCDMEVLVMMMLVFCIDINGWWWQTGARGGGSSYAEGVIFITFFCIDYDRLID